MIWEAISDPCTRCHWALLIITVINTIHLVMLWTQDYCIRRDLRRRDGANLALRLVEIALERPQVDIEFDQLLGLGRAAVAGRFELGYMFARAKPVFGYANVDEAYRRRVDRMNAVCADSLLLVLFVKDYQAKFNRAPTHTQIARWLGYRSTGSTERAITWLQHKGIVRRGRKWRSLTLS